MIQCWSRPCRAIIMCHDAALLYNRSLEGLGGYAGYRWDGSERDLSLDFGDVRGIICFPLFWFNRAILDGFYVEAWLQGNIWRCSRGLDPIGISGWVCNVHADLLLTREYDIFHVEGSFGILPYRGRMTSRQVRSESGEEGRSGGDKRGKMGEEKRTWLAWRADSVGSANDKVYCRIFCILFVHFFFCFFLVWAPICPM